MQADLSLASPVTNLLNGLGIIVVCGALWVLFTFVTRSADRVRDVMTTQIDSLKKELTTAIDALHRETELRIEALRESQDKRRHDVIGQFTSAIGKNENAIASIRDQHASKSDMARLEAKVDRIAEVQTETALLKQQISDFRATFVKAMERMESMYLGRPEVRQ